MTDVPDCVSLNEILVKLSVRGSVWLWYMYSFSTALVKITRPGYGMNVILMFECLFNFPMKMILQITVRITMGDNGIVIIIILIFTIVVIITLIINS